MMEQLLAPALVRPGEAAVYDQLQGEKIHLLLSGPETGGACTLLIDEVPAHAGPPLHSHDNEDETFYLLAGELVLQVNEEQFVLSAGQAAYLRRGVPHTFTNRGAETARALVVLTPGGLEGFFAEVEPFVPAGEPDMTAVLSVAAQYGIAAVGPPIAGQVNDRPIAGNNSRAISAEAVSTIQFPDGDTVHFLLTGEQTGGQFALLQGLFPPGTGAGWHRHQRDMEVIFVLEGELELQLGLERKTAAAGSAAILPPQIAHSFRNNGAQNARALALITPSGFENYFREMQALLAAGELDEETMAAVDKKYGLESLKE